MEARKHYEEEILKAVQTLPEEQLTKVVSLIEKLQQEEKQREEYRSAIDEARGKYKGQLSRVDEFIRRKQEEKQLDR